MPLAGYSHPVSKLRVPVASFSTKHVSASRCSSMLRQSGRFGHHHLRCLYTSTTQSSLHGLRQKSKEHPVLVFQSTSDNPYHNLAIEHYLLTQSDVNSRILLFYTNRPCVVIGRNQNPWTECNLKLLQDGANGQSIDLVRRRSGGGTVFHDAGNLNFSVIVPNDKDFTRRVHAEMVVRAINELHVVAAEYDGPENIWVNDRHDITMLTMHNKARSEFKVSGSAFKLTRGRALHHGTLLHSSPNLDNISKFLRSPGRDWIHARGVESVRSPVMNLFNVQNTDERNRLRSQIMTEIVRSFLKLYNASTPVEFVGDYDCLEEVNLEVARGVEELQTNDWRFDQTPRFDVASKVVAGKKLTFEVKNGFIEDPRLGPAEQAIEQRIKLKLRRPQKVYEIDDWCSVFEPGSVDEDQLAIVAQLFPNLRNFLHGQDSAGRVESASVEQKPEGVVRHLQDGSVEKETSHNTVEEVKG